MREARIHWGVENNPYQFDIEGTSPLGGARTARGHVYMRDMVEKGEAVGGGGGAQRRRLPGFEPPERGV